MDGFCIVIRHVQSMDNLFGVKKWNSNREKLNGNVYFIAENSRKKKRFLKSSSAPVANRQTTKPPPTSNSSSSLLSVDMGLSVTPYQIRPLNYPTNADLNQRFRRLHMRAPLRPLIARTTYDFQPPLEINAHRLINRHNEHQHRDSHLFSPPLLREPIQRLNMEFHQDGIVPPTIVGRRLLERRRSNAK